MTLIWVTLFLLHQGHGLVPVVTVQLGEPVTFLCVFPEKFKSTTWLHWYKQSAGDTLQRILMLRQSVQPTYGAGFSDTKFITATDSKMSNLTILGTVDQDEGVYHCAYLDWTKTIWTGTYLSVKGDSERTSRYAVVKQSAASDRTRPADSETLQCSLLSESKNKTCSGDLNAFWFRAHSENSYPDIIYADGNKPHKCKKTSDTGRRCSYDFSKNINSSDHGTFYCAVATCGRILFGKGTNSREDKTPGSKAILLIVTIILLAISVIINIVFIWCNVQKSCKESPDLQARSGVTEDGQDLNYAALHFSGGRAPKGKKRELKTEESVYSQVKGSV